MLGRWGDRWQSDREQAQRSKARESETVDDYERAAVTNILPRMTSNLPSAQKQRWNDEAEELWDLDQFGAPTYGPGGCSFT